MSLELPRLPQYAPSHAEWQIWWQQVCEAIEGQEVRQDELLEQLQATQEAQAETQAELATTQTELAATQADLAAAQSQIADQVAALEAVNAAADAANAAAAAAQSAADSATTAASSANTAISQIETGTLPVAAVNVSGVQWGEVSPGVWGILP